MSDNEYDEDFDAYDEDFEASTGELLLCRTGLSRNFTAPLEDDVFCLSALTASYVVKLRLNQTCNRTPHLGEINTLRVCMQLSTVLLCNDLCKYLHCCRATMTWKCLTSRSEQTP